MNQTMELGLMIGVPILKYCYFIFFFVSSHSEDDESLKKQIKERMNKYENIKFPQETEDFIYHVLKDNFKDKLLDLHTIDFYMKFLNLKEKIISFYFEKIATLESEYKYTCDINSQLNNYILQLERLRMIVQPEVQITVNHHKMSQKTYLVAKGFWLDENGQKQRIYKKSLGRIEDFQHGKNDPAALEQGIKKIREMIISDYNKIYPE